LPGRKAMRFIGKRGTFCRGSTEIGLAGTATRHRAFQICMRRGNRARTGSPVLFYWQAFIRGESESVLFHNGTVSGWQTLEEELEGEGPASDSLLVAISASKYGLSAKELLSIPGFEKYVIFSTDNIDTAGDFIEVDGILFSNTSYQGW